MHRVVPPTIQNVRLVDVRLSRRGNASGESPTGTDHVSLTHSGVSYIGVSNIAGDSAIDYHLETMLPRTASSFNVASEFDLEALRGRYDGYFTDTNLPSSRTFEGYGLLATYGLRIEPTPSNLAAKDIVFRAAYFYQESDMIQSESAFMRRVLRSKKETRLSTLFPDLAPFSLVVQSDTQGCVLPTGEAKDTALFGRKDVFPAPAFEAVAFFGGKPARTKLSGKGARIADLQKKLDSLQQCSRAELATRCKPLDAVVERARSIGLQFDRDPTALNLRKELGIDEPMSYGEAFPVLAEKEFKDQGCDKEEGQWLDRRSLFAAQ